MITGPLENLTEQRTTPLEEGMPFVIQVVEYSTMQPVPQLALLVQGEERWICRTVTNENGEALARLISEGCPGSSPGENSADLLVLTEALSSISILPEPGQGYGVVDAQLRAESPSEERLIRRVFVAQYPMQYEVEILNAESSERVSADIYRVMRGQDVSRPFSPNLGEKIAEGSRMILPGIFEADRAIYCAVALGYRPMVFSALGFCDGPLALRLEPCINPSIQVVSAGDAVDAQVYWMTAADFLSFEPTGPSGPDFGVLVQGSLFVPQGKAVPLPFDVKNQSVDLSIARSPTERRIFGRLKIERMGPPPWNLDLAPATQSVRVKLRSVRGDAVPEVLIGLRAFAGASEDLGVRARDDQAYAPRFRAGFDAVGRTNVIGEWRGQIPVSEGLLCVLWRADESVQIIEAKDFPTIVSLEELHVQIELE